MLDDAYRKVFIENSDVAHGAIDNSSQSLAVREKGSQRFREVARYGRIPGGTGAPTQESFMVPYRDESMTGEARAYPEWRRRDVERREAARQQLDKENVFVKGTGKLSVNVKGPYQTAVRAEGGGIFDKTEVNRDLTK